MILEKKCIKSSFWLQLLRMDAPCSMAERLYKEEMETSEFKKKAKDNKVRSWKPTVEPCLTNSLKHYFKSEPQYYITLSDKMMICWALLSVPWWSVYRGSSVFLSILCLIIHFCDILFWLSLPILAVGILVFYANL